MNRSPIDMKSSMVIYFSIPMIVGLLLGWYQSGLGKFMSVWASIVSWITHFELFFLSGFAGLFVSKFLLQRFTSNFGLHLVLSTLLSITFVRPIYWSTYDLRRQLLLLSGADLPTEFASASILDLQGIEFLLTLGQLYFQDIVLWPSVIILLYMFGTFPFGLLMHNRAPFDVEKSETRGEQKEGEETPPEAAPDLSFFKLKPEIGTDILILKAEGHYTRVITPIGDDLVYCRFGDAIKHMGSAGNQVHRSYWVAQKILHAPDTVWTSKGIQVNEDILVPVGITFRSRFKEPT